MLNNMFGLEKTTIESILQVFQHYPAIEKVLLYGALGDNLSYPQLSQIETKLEALMLPYSIDLSLYHHIDNPDLVNHIQREGKIFYPMC